MDDTTSVPRAVNEPAESRRSIFKNPFVWAFFGGIVLLTLLRPALVRRPAPPSVKYELPEYRLISASGAPFGSADLAGFVYVANFVFTRCPSVCPRMTAAMASLQRRYDETGVDGVRLVSISVDPDYDTPERLREYGRIHGVDPRRWTLLTGELSAIRELVFGGFRTPIGEPDPEGNLVDIAHSTKFVLVDGEGRIRGYYDSDETGVDELYHRSRHVLAESRRR